MPKTPINDNLKTKVIPGLTAKHQIVALPYWAWYWLEDFMKVNRISYQGIYDTFGTHLQTGGSIGDTLRQLAEMHHEYSMREIYNLANDNEPDESDIIARINKKKSKTKAKPKAFVLPKIYKLFGFMSCATTLEAVWERRHYQDDNRIR
jgi:hypothetical protein